MKVREAKKKARSILLLFSIRFLFFSPSFVLVLSFLFLSLSARASETHREEQRRVCREEKRRDVARQRKRKNEQTTTDHCLVHEKRRALDRRERVGEPPRLLVLGLALGRDERGCAAQGRGARVLGWSMGGERGEEKMSKGSIE